MLVKCEEVNLNLKFCVKSDNFYFVTCSAGLAVLFLFGLTVFASKQLRVKYPGKKLITDTYTNCIVLLSYRLSYFALPVFSPVSLNVSPNRQQFFTGESVRVSCEEEESSSGWKLKRISVVQTETCGTEGFGRLNGSSCIISDLSPLTDRGVYWCENWSEQRSIKVVITVSGRKATVCWFSMSGVCVHIVWVYMENLATCCLWESWERQCSVRDLDWFVILLASEGYSLSRCCNCVDF